MKGTAPDGTAYELVGSPSAPVVVLIHGLGLNKDCWQWMVPALTDGYRVLRYDLFGHGESSAPPDEPSLPLFSAQLAALLDHCAISRAAIAGFSLGGMIARRFAQDMPDRTQALVLLHTPHKRDDAAQAAILKRVAQARDEGPQSTVEAALERWFTAPFRADNPEVMGLVRSWVTANKKQIYHTVYRVLATGIDEIVAPQPALSCPALVLTGDEDYGNGPEMTRAIAAEISGAQVLVLKGLRHMALAEAPDAVNTPIRQFLDSLALSP
ncbi:MAG: alpha/beta fold hydrolase [Roseicyclus sp.]|jgi:pimeloyl-ACP methyl ester carboxylesterase|uniref:alpha/beta fold hydrolase n=1 Tax=Roseicyclus sp. TaxID=1914329 RepID=UPI003BB1CEB0